MCPRRYIDGGSVSRDHRAGGFERYLTPERPSPRSQREIVVVDINNDRQQRESATLNDRQLAERGREDTRRNENEGIPSLGPEPFLNGVEGVLSPEGINDLTYHLECTIGLDLSAALEELARFRQMGHFHAAEQYIQDTLAGHLDHPVVLLEHADLLLEQGGYRGFKELQLASIIGPLERVGFFEPQEVEGGDESRMERACLELMAVRAALARSSHFLDRILNVEHHDGIKYLQRRHARENVPWTSIEILFIRDWLCIVAYGRSESSLFRRIPFQDLCKDWQGLYKSLQTDRRIWEFDSLFFALANLMGLDGAWKQMLPPTTNLATKAGVDRFLWDWETGDGEDDESTCLALLAICTKMSSGLVRHAQSDRDLAAARIWLQSGQQFAERIHQSHPACVPSRPFLRWILAQEHLASVMARQAAAQEGREASTGLIDGDNIVGLDIYVPDSMEREAPPRPRPIHVTPDNRPLLTTALQTARQLGDYEIEAQCLIELIRRAEEPEELCTQLHHLHEQTRGDLISARYVQLYRYRLCTDNTARRDLCESIRGPRSSDATLRHPPALRMYELRVKSALWMALGKYPAEAKDCANAARDLEPFAPRYQPGYISQLRGFNHQDDSDDDDDNPHWNSPRSLVVPPSRIIHRRPVRSHYNEEASSSANDTDDSSVLPSSSREKAVIRDVKTWVDQSQNARTSGKHMELLKTHPRLQPVDRQNPQQTNLQSPEIVDLDEPVHPVDLRPPEKKDNALEAPAEGGETPVLGKGKGKSKDPNTPQVTVEETPDESPEKL
ncbi:hypothetical protein ASPZODRAFT_20789 [Penicilliopsis zonata CBS 506.65]|uniref:Uncharacterized protein n=1 Tax=Penicilliopsis zonata CBS 506.65 TaxID=1073090 RepID=A0A1L9S4M4_9EURO|nr:hypothetical protein ASPZODRAFT_20789 [Penicilliopsis zonata CBS 506.65]OJJ42102.1 hypothetical protein ASPZODRAFT_20789 [Penicilliopsis zonata CBS 506.65]